MSADGIGILGLAALTIGVAPLLIAGAGIAGTIYGVNKLSQRSQQKQQSRQFQEERERRIAMELAREEAEERRQIELLRQNLSGIQERYHQAARRLCEIREQGLAQLSASLNAELQRGSSDMLRLEQQARQRRVTLEAEWRNTSQQLNQQYAEDLTQVFGKLKSKVAAQSEQMEQFKNTIAEDTRIREMAVKQLQDAKITIKTLALELGVVPPQVQSSLNQATDYYKEGLYVNSYSLASNLTLLCYDLLEEGLAKREAYEALADWIEQRAALLEARMESAKAFHFHYQDAEYEDDLSRFEPRLYAAVAARLHTVCVALGSSSGNIPDLLAQQSIMDELEEDYDEILKMAVNKLLYAYAENDTAADIAAAMCDQGFEVEGYAYEADTEGNAIHINFFNSLSREKLTVVLTPDQSGLKVDVHHFGDGHSQTDPSRQDRIREILEQALNISISCSNRGGISARTEAANLSRVKTAQPVALRNS